MRLVPHSPSSLLERTRNLAVLSEDELKRFAAEACRDRDVEALWALLEAVGCHLLLLPPYSPDFNKIEHLWHTIKSMVSHISDSSLSLMDKLNLAFCSFYWVKNYSDQWRQASDNRF